MCKYRERHTDLCISGKLSMDDRKKSKRSTQSLSEQKNSLLLESSVRSVR